MKRRAIAWSRRLGHFRRLVDPSADVVTTLRGRSTCDGGHMARTRARLGTAITLCAVLALGGCGNDQVDDLTADPIASTTPPGGELVTSREEEAEGGGLLGKPSPVKVLRTYAFQSEAAARRAMGDLQGEAQDAGWEITFVAPNDTSFSAARPLDGRDATLDVALNLDPAFSPAPGVFVSLSSTDG